MKIKGKEDKKEWQKGSKDTQWSWKNLKVKLNRYERITNKTHNILTNTLKFILNNVK